MTIVADPLSLTRLLDEAVRLARHNFRVLYLPLALPVACAATVMTALQVGAGMGGRGVPSMVMVGLFVVAVVLMVLVSMAAYVALTAACVDIVAGRPVDVSRAWGTILSPRLFGTWVLAGVGMFFGILCCFLPGLYAMLAWSLITPVMLEERVYGIGAMRRSHQLMTHNPSGNLGHHPMLNWFLILVTAGLLSYALSLVISLPMMAAIGFVVARGALSGSAGNAEEAMQSVMWIQVPTQFASQLVQMGVHIFSMMALALLYFEVRRRREGDDLDAAVSGVGLPTVP